VTVAFDGVGHASASDFDSERVDMRVENGILTVVGRAFVARSLGIDFLAVLGRRRRRLTAEFVQTTVCDFVGFVVYQVVPSESFPDDRRGTVEVVAGRYLVR